MTGRKRGAEKQTRHRRVQMQMAALLLLFTLLTTFLTGWIIYSRSSEQVIQDAWEQHQALLTNACMAVNRQIEQIKSFSWQLSNDNGVQRYLHLTEQEPKDILTKQAIIEKLQQMKAFSTTITDMGVYAEGADIVITAESSYRAQDYYSRVGGVSMEDMLAIRCRPGAVALSHFVGAGTIRRILSVEPILVFVSNLPLNTQAGKSYLFFHLSGERLKACMPESESGALILTDGTGTPVVPETDPRYAEVSRAWMREKSSRVRTGDGDFGVLSMETEAEGLTCMAIVPYDDLLKPSLRLRNVVMLVMGLCMAVGLVAAMLASRRMYAPLERLIDHVRQIRHALPAETRGNEYQMLDDAIHMISAGNHALTLSNREVNRLLKNRLLSDWLEGRMRGKAEEALSRIGVTMPYDRVQIAVAEAAPRDLERLEARSPGMGIADRMEEIANGEDRGPMKIWCVRRTDGKILILFNLDAGHPAPESIYQYLQNCRDTLFADCPCMIGVGRAYDRSRAADSLVEALMALSNGMEENRDIAFAEEIPEVSETEYTLTAEQQLINQILSGNRAEAEKLLRTLLRPEEGAAAPSADLVRALLYTAGRAARRAGMEDQLEEILQENEFSADRMPAEADTAERLQRVFAALTDRMNADVSTQEEKLYARLTDYIRKEYRNDISLDSASEALSMSPSYIGLVFRRVGGTSFLKYLTDVRMEETKRLLSTTDLTLREIGVQVGIENQNTLIRTFKKAEGITPGQYRMANPHMDSQNG